MYIVELVSIAPDFYKSYSAILLNPIGAIFGIGEEFARDYSIDYVVDFGHC